jgi:hypothetical protein
MDNTKVLDQMVLVVQAITLWSGKVKIDRERDFVGVADKLPPKALVSDGEINLVNPKHLNVLAAKRTAVQRVLEKHGLRFIGGALVHKDKADEAFEEIERIRADFDEVLAALEKNLPAYYAEQESAFPQYVELMRKHRVDAAEVRKRHQWRVTAFTMGEPGTAKADAAFASAEGSVAQALLDAIAREAKVLQKSFHGRQSIGQRGLNCVKEIVSKLDSFAFVDARVYPCVLSLRTVLDSLPRRNELTPSQTQTVLGVLARLVDPDELVAQGRAVMAGLPASVAIEVEEPEQTAQVGLPLQVIPARPVPLPVWSGATVL